MLTAEGCRARRQRLWDSIEEDLDWILIGDPKHQMYFANYYPDPFVFRTATAASLLLLHRDGRSILVADSMVKAFAELSLVDEVFVPTWYDGHHTAPPRGLLLLQNALEKINEAGGQRFGVESASLPSGIVQGISSKNPKATFTPVDKAIHRLKRQKDPDELELMRRSIHAMEAGFHAARTDIHAGMTELDAFHVIEKASRDALGDQMPIYGDFASGLNTIHGGFPTLKVIEKGDIFLLDYSVEVFYYRGDFANGWVVDAKATDEVRRMHEVSCEALAAGEALLKAGTPCRDVDKAIHQSFAAKGLEEYFTSHSGHGIGLGHPDPPYIVAESDDVLMVGDVVTLEPSQKVPGVGCVRVEHNYLITADGAERLSNHSLTVDDSGS